MNEILDYQNINDGIEMINEEVESLEKSRFEKSRINNPINTPRSRDPSPIIELQEAEKYFDDEEI
jgi:hypothetical protein